MDHRIDPLDKAGFGIKHAHDPGSEPGDSCAGNISCFGVEVFCQVLESQHHDPIPGVVEVVEAQSVPILSRRVCILLARG